MEQCALTLNTWPIISIPGNTILVHYLLAHRSCRASVGSGAAATSPRSSASRRLPSGNPAHSAAGNLLPASAVVVVSVRPVAVVAAFSGGPAVVAGTLLEGAAARSAAAQAHRPSAATRSPPSAAVEVRSAAPAAARTRSAAVQEAVVSAPVRRLSAVREPARSVAGLVRLDLGAVAASGAAPSVAALRSGRVVVTLVSVRLHRLEEVVVVDSEVVHQRLVEVLLPLSAVAQVHLHLAAVVLLDSVPRAGAAHLAEDQRSEEDLEPLHLERTTHRLLRELAHIRGRSRRWTVEKASSSRSAR